MEILQSRIHKSRISSLQPELVMPKIRTSSCVNSIDFQTCVDYFSVLYHKKIKKDIKNNSSRYSGTACDTKTDESCASCMVS